MPKEIKKEEYTAKDIYVLEGLDPVRKRPGMYIGSTGPDGLHHLIWEVVDNGLDEAMAGYAKNIEVVLLSNSRVKISDDGRGIPVEKHAQTKKSALETVMTTLHAGGKFGGDAYKVSGGLHGVGVSVVCALSNYSKAEICRGGIKYYQEYAKGKVKGAVKKDGTCKQTGTTIIFEPDNTIFTETVFNKKKILTHLRQQAYLTKGVKITVRDEREELKTSHSFYFDGGLASYVKYLVYGNITRHPNVFYCSGEKNGLLVEAAFQYTQEYECNEQSFANNIFTGEGGTHLTGFRTALTRTLNDWARKNDVLKEADANLSGEDIREGLTGVVSIKIKDPQFEGQTKAKLGNVEAKTAVDQVVSEHLTDFLERNPQDARAIIEKCLLSSRARKAARAARETVLRKGVLEGLALPGKLADCSSKKPEESELFIVEGESAGGCFSGDTRVALADGRDVSFEDLIKEDKQGKKNYCYTIRKDGSIGLELIKHPRKTKSDADVIKVVLDNDEEIICTPDHLFMTRDGSYKKAEELTVKDSLCSRFFDGNEDKLKEAVLNFNHKIKRIVKLSRKTDVYDIEVEGTHNFALANGIFVHNSGKQGRNRRFQAILPLRGKILNVERARLDKILNSKEIRALIIALGTAIADDFNIDKLRYHRIILMADADSDGNHIKTLLLTLFYRHFRPIIEKGYLYAAQPPLYRIQSGKSMQYAYSDQEKEKILASLEKNKIAPSIQRYKGLGEMNPAQLWETTMDPEKRVLLQINIEDAKEADRIFDTLMGDEVPPRKKFIQTYAKEVKNLDI